MNSLFIKPIFVVLIFIFLLPAKQALAEEWDDLLGDAQLESSTKQSAPKLRFRHQNNNKPAYGTNLEVVKRLDQEILILRAERSQRHGDTRQVQRYLDQLDKQQILPPFITRVKELKQYVAQNARSSTIASRFVQNIDFPMHDSSAVVAIVLPTSGDYEKAGLVLQQSIQTALNKAGFRGKLIALDSNLYASAFDLWELLKYYEPDFIFGPLTKDKVQGWQQLQTGIATLYFNEVAYLGVGEFSLSPSRQAGLEQVFQVLQQEAINRVLLLTDKSDKSSELAQGFLEAWQTLHGNNNHQIKLIEGNVGKSIDSVIGIQQSKERARWMEHVLKSNLQFESRQRSDAQAVVSIVPQELAIQISPYLQFLANKDSLLHVWYPSTTPSAKYLDFNSDALPNTMAILPQNISMQSERNHFSINPSSKDGLFYALGRVAVEIVKNSTPSSELDSVEFTDFGSYVRNASGQFYLLPVVYKAEKGLFKAY